jgi:hypothetical protein
MDEVIEKTFRESNLLATFTATPCYVEEKLRTAKILKLLIAFCVVACVLFFCTFTLMVSDLTFLFSIFYFFHFFLQGKCLCPRENHQLTSYNFRAIHNGEFNYDILHSELFLL